MWNQRARTAERFLLSFCSSSVAAVPFSSLVVGYCGSGGDLNLVHSGCPRSWNLIPFPFRCGGVSHPLPQFSTATEPILVRARDPSRVAAELIEALNGGRLDAAWRLYEQYVHMEEFPRKSVAARLIVGLAESFDRNWLDKAYRLVELPSPEQRKNELERDPLLYLSYILARCGMHVAAASVLRKLVEMEAYPHVKVWVGVIGHMCRTNEGTFLAAELVGEFGYRFKDNRVDPRKRSNWPLLSMKPNSQAFNMALTGCLLFGTTKKAEELLELMPRVGVKADADLLILMAHIYDRNGRLNEIRKLKRHVDEACGLSYVQFQQFYDCLLSCHLKFRDIDSASEIVLDMLRKASVAKTSLLAAKTIVNAVQSGSVSVNHGVLKSVLSEPSDKIKRIMSQPPSFEEFCRDSSFSRLSYEAKERLIELQGRLQTHIELVKSEYGILHPTETIYAKLVRSFLEVGKTGDLAKFLTDASKLETPLSNDKSAVVQVINACISLCLLDQAHDLLDEMRFRGVRVASSVYSSLLKAYCKEGRLGEVKALLKDARKAGVQLDSNCYEALIQSHARQKDINDALNLFKEMHDSSLSRSSQHEFNLLVEQCEGSGEVGLTAKLLDEIKDDNKSDCGVHDWNSVIHFFCKKRMMQDAQKALKKMRILGHIPNAQTFHSLVTAYAAIGGKYVEVTDLWGEMKVLIDKSSIKLDQELLDSLLYCFVRGGFFLRANEIVVIMEREGMFIDKYKYRTLWLKYHRTLYKGKTPKIQTDAQCERREAALSFKKWINLT